MDNIFTKSDKFTSEYCISVVRIGEISPIEGKDKIGKTLINGESVVVNKNDVHEGDIMFYASNETELNRSFLSANNLFDAQNYELNSNRDDIEQYIVKRKQLKDSLVVFKNNEKQLKIVQDEFDLADSEIKKNTGFFTDKCRVKMIRLGGVQSLGFVFSINEMQKYNPKVTEINLENYVGTDFDTVDGELFVKAYVPKTHQTRRSKNHSENRNNKKIRRFDRLIDGEFKLHYDSDPLKKCINQISPTDTVSITVKVHGTSFVCGKLHVKTPIKLAFLKRIKNKFIDITGLFKNKRTQDWVVEYGNITSSRKVIKNQYINNNVGDGY